MKIDEKLCLYMNIENVVFVIHLPGKSWYDHTRGNHQIVYYRNTGYRFIDCQIVYGKSCDYQIVDCKNCDYWNFYSQNFYFKNCDFKNWDYFELGGGYDYFHFHHYLPSLSQTMDVFFNFLLERVFLFWHKNLHGHICKYAVIWIEKNTLPWNFTYRKIHC